ncbi:unnamed protein product [Thelazia callipaeda]|uniref:Protein UL8 n=1 Tax=Thelazia callipaeda TaxID=103827 RepID=A0A0N5D506_THECL|nr:unnamed protein product [Thelazia callipaeda]
MWDVGWTVLRQDQIDNSGKNQVKDENDYYSDTDTDTDIDTYTDTDKDTETNTNFWRKMDSLVNKAIKSEQFVKALKSEQRNNKTSRHPLPTKDNVKKCVGKHCSKNSAHSWNQNKNNDHTTVSWIENTQLQRLMMNLAKVEDYLQQIFNNRKIKVESEQREDGFYMLAMIPAEQALSDENINEKTNNGLESVTQEPHTLADDVTNVIGFTHSMEVIKTSNASTTPVIPVPSGWWNSIWFWTIHLIAVILFLILVLSCCIWFFGSRKRRDYNRI